MTTEDFIAELYRFVSRIAPPNAPVSSVQLSSQVGEAFHGRALADWCD